MSEAIDYRALEEPVVRAFLATTGWVRVVKGQRVEEMMSDQARRVGILIARLSFGRGREGLWVGDLESLAPALEIDASDCSKAVRRLRAYELLGVEARAGGVWLQLRPMRLAMHERAVRAGVAAEELAAAHDRAVGEPQLIAPSREERRDRGFASALAEADAEETLRGVETSASGRCPRGSDREGREGESPHQRRGESPACWGESPPEKGETPQRYSREQARADSIESVQIDRSTNRGAVARESGSARFRDEERNHIFAELEAIDVLGEMRDPTPTAGGITRGEMCTRTWLARVGNSLPFIREALGVVKDLRRTGKKVGSPLGAVFTTGRKYAREAGKDLRSWLFC